MRRTFVIGDIHGAYRALLQCLERSGFNNSTDHLICLGDVCDGWPDTSQAIDALLTINKLTYLLGNHDFWTLEWMKTGYPDEIWLSQGGQATVNSYRDGVDENHIMFLNNAKKYFVLDNKVYVHAGIDLTKSLEQQSLNTLIWDRNFAKQALDLYQQNTQQKFGEYEGIYIGHTPVASDGPICSGNVWFMDTGAGWSGKLSMMDVDTYGVFQSDLVPTLYPGVQGRSKK
jgi:serine/threonine protein phosphatase 1